MYVRSTVSESRLGTGVVVLGWAGVSVWWVVCSGEGIDSWKSKRPLRQTKREFLSLVAKVLWPLLA